jgi:hypothetical protein
MNAFWRWRSLNVAGCPDRSRAWPSRPGGNLHGQFTPAGELVMRLALTEMAAMDHRAAAGAEARLGGRILLGAALPKWAGF